MFKVYNRETRKVETVEKIDPKIHLHRNTHLPLVVEEEVEDEAVEVSTEPKKRWRKAK